MASSFLDVPRFSDEKSELVIYNHKASERVDCKH
jgi:hypothetical protein